MNTMPNIYNIPKTLVDWANWIEQHESRTLNVYLEEPYRLIADYRREKQISKDYQGREILELLQNANDAAAEQNIKGKVRIELHHTGLIVANTGMPFSTDGINSLRISDLSPKIHKKIKYIGQKGLGFRAVLNWSRQPIILSGALKLTYSPKKLEVISNNLIQSNEEINKIIENERRIPDELILATLPFPIIINEHNYYQHVKAENHSEILEQCIYLRNEYDTVIGMSFDQQEIFELAKKEIDALRPEILLFTENIEQLNINISENEEKYWKIEWQNDIAVLIDNGKVTEYKWRVFKETNTIPSEFSSESLSNEYQIVIAVPINDSIKAPTSLFSYFPLLIDFPFPVICHATFELETNRKHPQAGNPNQYIFDRIAILLSKIAEMRYSDTDQWIKARTIARMRDYDTILQKFRFGHKLLDILNEKKIIPTVDKLFKKPNETKILKASDLSWLPDTYFSDICIPTGEYQLQKLLDELNINELDTDELRDRLNLIEFSSIEQRAKVIANLIQHKLLPSDPTPDLLINTDENIIKHDQRVYLLPEEYKNYKLPSWVNIKFVNEHLRERLSDFLLTKDRRELRQRLDDFGVQEYSIRNIAGAIVAEAKRVFKSNEHIAEQIQEQMLVCLYDLFPEDNKPSKLDETTGVPLKNMEGTFSDSREMYFGEHYSENGGLLAALYKNKPDKILAPLDQIGMKGDDPRTISFLKWLGVNSLPEIIYLDKAEKEYLNYIIENISYPINLDGYQYDKYTDFNLPSVSNVKSIDSLEEILKTDPAAILTWLAIDNRAVVWRYPDHTNAVLYEKPYRAQNTRQYRGNIPSYIVWRLKNTEWLPSAIGTIEKPVRCIFGERGLEKLFPPPAEFQHELFDKYKIDRNDLRKAYENAGVIPDISYLDPSEILRILTELPKLDPEGKNARSLYRTLIERIDPERMSWPELPYLFKENCKMLGKGPNGHTYYTIRELHHADYDDFPIILYNHLPIVDLPKKVGAQKVKRIFGIDPIERKTIKRRIDRAVDIPESRDIQFQLNRIKPYIYALRQVRTKGITDIGTFKDLEIILCSSIDITIIYKNIEEQESFEQPYQWILEENKAYILYLSDEKPSLESDLLADTIGSIIASTFNLTQSGDFARLIRCSDRYRDELLKKMLGEEDIPDLNQIKREFDQVGTGFSIELTPPFKKGIPTENLDDTKSGEDISSEQSKTVIVDKGAGNIIVTPKNNVPHPAPIKKAKIHRKSPVKQSRINRSKLKRITDWGVCEERAKQFEMLEKRVVISVSGITGYDGPRCDLISFSNEENMNRFLSGDGSVKRDLLLVSRFIEVKGRASEDAPISLKGNELDAAKTYGDKYFLYRLYQETENKYILDILRNPLKHEEAIERVVDIYIKRARDINSYDLHLVENEPQSE
jgi:hypothetical protein